MKKDIHRKKTHHQVTHAPRRQVNKEEKLPVLEFRAQEFPHYSKDQFWYVGIGLLLISFFILAVRSRDWTSALVVIAAGIAIFRLANLRPQSKEVRITVRGIYWGDQFYSYHQLRAFWIAETKDQFNIYLEPLNFMPPLHLIVPHTQAGVATMFLSEFLPWHEHKNEPLLDKLSRWLRL